MFECNKGQPETAIRRRTDNTMTKEETMIYKTLHRKEKTKQHELH